MVNHFNHRIERLPNGFVRCEAPSGLVTLWERDSQGTLYRRSGQGMIPWTVVDRIEEMLP